MPDFNAHNPISLRPFLITSLIAGLWINISEIFRYFVFVMPMMRSTFGQISNVAPMNLSVFAMWGIWDTILMVTVTGFFWIAFDRFGNSLLVVLKAAIFVWAGIFVILWLGLFNMNLAPISVLLVALPLALVEMIIAGFIVRWARTRFTSHS